MSKAIFIPLLVFVLLFSTIFSGTNDVHAAKKIINNTADQTYIERYTDDDGNEGILEYIISGDQVRVNSYINGILNDYSVSTEDHEGNSVIDAYIIDAETNIEFGENIPSDVNVKQQQRHLSESIIKVVEEDTSFDDQMTINSVPGMNWIRSTNLGGVVGHLYKDTFVTNTEKFHFDFGVDMLISTVAARITIIWGAPIVAISVLLASLAITFTHSVIKTPLNGYYDAKAYKDNYVVQVSNKNVYYHTSERIVTYYFSQRTAKEFTRTTYKSNHLMEADILTKGIQIAIRQGIY